jgi:hypothetical protein
MPSQTTPASPSRQDPFRWNRIDSAAAFAAFADPHDRPSSQRRFASEHGIPHSTLNYWLRRDGAPLDGIDPDLAAVLRSPAGVAFLRRVVLALFLVFVFRSLCGVRAIGLFLRLTQLDRFVGSSFGALYDLGVHLQNDLVAFDQEERSRLASDMPERSIVACLDENFHRKLPYLVAIEPSSNFILLESHSATRDADAWTKAVKDATAGLRVKLVLLCSDRARGLIKCAKDGFAVPHSPDTMHMQRDILQPLLQPLNRQISKSRQELQQLQELRASWQKRKEEAQSKPGGPGRPLDDAGRINTVQSLIEQEQKALEQGERRLERASAAIREMADIAHPFDPENGSPVDAAGIEKRLEQTMGKLVRVAEEADALQQASSGLCKGYDWVPVIMMLVTWFWTRIRERVENLNLPEEAQRAVEEKLLPGLYWQQQTRRGRNAQQKKERQELSERLLKEAWQEGGALRRLTPEQQKEVNRQGKELAGLFVRSSSCVEGRNGRLSLLQHGHMHLGEQRLKAQTVIHNYFTEREDGTTAAERFFGAEQRNLFDWLLHKMPDLPYPASRRPQKADPTLSPPGSH